MINTVTETPLESEGNPYWTWIRNYAEDSFQDAVKAGKGKAIWRKKDSCTVVARSIDMLGVDLLEELAIQRVSTSPARFREACEIFEQATRLEISFWEMGLKRQWVPRCIIIIIVKNLTRIMKKKRDAVV